MVEEPRGVGHGTHHGLLLEMGRRGHVRAQVVKPTIVIDIGKITPHATPGGVGEGVFADREKSPVFIILVKAVRGVEVVGNVDKTG